MKHLILTSGVKYDTDGSYVIDLNGQYVKGLNMKKNYWCPFNGFFFFFFFSCLGVFTLLCFTSQFHLSNRCFDAALEN